MPVVEFPQKRISEILSAEFDKQYAEHEAKIKAQEARIYANDEILREQAERIGDQAIDLQLKEEVDELKRQCREFADG